MDYLFMYMNMFNEETPLRATMWHASDLAYVMNILVYLGMINIVVAFFGQSDYL
jgi:hypothetical protein